MHQEIRLHNLVKRKVIYSCDVQFNKNVKDGEHSAVDMGNDSNYQLLIDFMDDIET